jgi:hypothetical protein
MEMIIWTFICVLMSVFGYEYTVVEYSMEAFYIKHNIL